MAAQRRREGEGGQMRNDRGGVEQPREEKPYAAVTRRGFRSWWGSQSRRRRRAGTGRPRQSPFPLPLLGLEKEKEQGKRASQGDHGCQRGEQGRWCSTKGWC